MLCLANSERIKLTAWVHMVFEVQDLVQASPATVSRCGMVYVDPEDLGWLPLVDSWKSGDIKKKLQPKQMEYLYELYTSHFHELLDYGKKHGSFVIHQVASSKVNLCLQLMSALIEMIPWLNMEETEYKPLLNKIYVWCVLWSQSSNFKDEDKVSFEQHIRTVMGSDE